MRRYVFRLAVLSLAALGPSVVGADDQQIAQQIMQKLKAEKDAGTLKGFSIDLQVDDGTVWLSGRVASDQQKARALDMARRISGVQQVVDDLTIGAAPPKTPIVASNPIPGGKPGIVMLPQPAVASSPPPAPRTGPSDQRPATGMPMNNPFVAAAPTPAARSAAPAYDPAPVASVPAIPLTEPAMMNQVAESPTPAKSARKSSSQSGVLNSIGKTLVSAVQGGRQPDEARPIQPASVSQDVAAATGTPIGSGVDPSAATSRRSVVQAAQPVANVPQSVMTADSLQPVYGGPPQMAMMPMQPYAVPYYAGSQMQVPLAMGPARPVNYTQVGGVPAGAAGAPVPMYMPGSGVGIAPARYDHPTMPGYAWPSYAAYPNYAAVTYPKQYSPTAWPYIGPFYPYPQVPLGWRKVTLEWDDGWWFLDFKDRRTMYNH